MALLCLQVTWLLSLLSLHVLLPDLAAAACPQNQYEEFSEGRAVCCDFCDEGQEIIPGTTCTPRNKASQCRNCKAKYFNPKNVRGLCEQCTVCNTAEGSIELKPCTKNSNAVCGCPEGSIPKNDEKTACRCDRGREIVNNICQPCKPGYFSTKENSKQCLQWTDCKAIGEEIAQQGSAIKDVTCTKRKNNPVTIGIPTTSLSPSSTSHRRKVSSPPNVTATATTITTMNHILTSGNHTPRNSHEWGTLSLIIIGAVLLLVSGGIILTMIMQIKHKKMHRGFIRGERVRVPIQEESTSSDSSLHKECPA